MGTFFLIRRRNRHSNGSWTKRPALLDAPLAKTLGQLVPERFAEALCLHIACDPQTAIAQLPRKDRNRLIEALTTFRFPVKEHRGWNYAEVTAGGVPLEEINYRTMESKLVPGLYLVGEISIAMAASAASTFNGLGPRGGSRDVRVPWTPR